MEGAVTEKSIRPGASIFANPPVFLASWGFSKNSGSSPAYPAENRARAKRLKRPPR